MTMPHSSLLEYCLQKPGAYVDHPFGPDSTIVKVCGKIFAQLFFLHGVPMMTVNYDAAVGEIFRHLYPDAVRRGYHCPPVQQPYFNTVDLSAGLPQEELLRMIDHSYARVVAKLPKKVRPAPLQTPDGE